jgi:hypothetical protein
MIDFQSIATYIIVVLAAVYVGRVLFKQLAPLGKSKGGDGSESPCGGCSGCSGSSPKLITLSAAPPRRRPKPPTTSDVCTLDDNATPSSDTSNRAEPGP